MKVFNVTRYRIPALSASAFMIVMLLTYTIFVAGGFNFGIDIQAGLNITVDVPEAADEEAIRSALDEFNPQVQTVGDDTGRFLVRIADDETVDNFQQETSRAVMDALKDQFGDAMLQSQEYVGTNFAGSLTTQTLWVTLLTLGLILVYVWIRFRLNYAVSAIAAIFHDVLFLLGFIGAFGLEFSTATIAAVLTIIGYSLNDTIVIFDRIRENARIVKDKNFNEIINISISQSLSRTLMTSITTLLAVLAILIFATGTIRTFALNLTVGVLVGTYSSIFVASPILLAWHNRTANRAKNLKTSSQNVRTSSSLAPRPKKVADPIKQTAEEIAEATEKRAKAKAKKKKKKK